MMTCGPESSAIMNNLSFSCNSNDSYHDDHDHNDDNDDNNNDNGPFEICQIVMF